MKDNIPSSCITLMLCGDVMTGRGIDQILPHPSDPRLYEPWVRDARAYVALAERAHGPIPQPVAPACIWGDALALLEAAAPDARLINLETSVTTSPDWWRGKGINYRMHPANLACLTTAKIDLCTLANNHVLDWGYAGLDETLQSLEGAGIRCAGAGSNLAAAAAPALLEIGGKGRVLLFGCGLASSGIPEAWGATMQRAGVHLLPDLSVRTVQALAEQVRRVKRGGDLVVFSIHWGPNWGYEVSAEEQAFARALIDGAGADIVHGHSSHHVKGIEVYRGRPIFYGCGDLLNDYEGIGGKEAYRGELSLIYLLRMDAKNGDLAGLTMLPLRMARFRLQRASQAEANWLLATLNREGERFGTRAELDQRKALHLRWG